ARPNRPLPAIQAPELLEDLPRLRHPRRLPLDPDLAMARQHLHPQGVTHLAKVLVSTAKDRQLLVVTVETDRCFHFIPSRPVGRGIPPAQFNRSLHYEPPRSKNAMSSRRSDCPCKHAINHDTTRTWACPAVPRRSIGLGVQSRRAGQGGQCHGRLG